MIPPIKRVRGKVQMAASGTVSTKPAFTTPGEEAGHIHASTIGATRLSRRQLCALAGLVIILDAALVGPLIGPGNLHLLDLGDYPATPHPPFAPSFFGLPPGITSRAPVEALLYWLFQTIHWEPVSLLPYAAIAPLACAGFSRTFPGRGTAIGAAVLLYTVNPFIYERMANGQVYVVMGYSLLPVLLGLVVRPFASLLATSALGGLVFTLSIALSVHYLFISGLLLTLVVISHFFLGQKKVALAAAGSLISGAFLNLYWLIPAVRAIRTMHSPVTSLDLSVFQTLGNGMWGVALNVAGLYGFWRSGPPLVENNISGWPFLLITILVVAGIGIHEMWTTPGSNGRALTLSCITLAIAGGLLAVGGRGPTAGVYTWFFDHLPGFKVMREAEKFSALLALGYATSFGAGADAVARPLAQNTTKILCVFCIAAIPITYGYTELWGFDGYARPSVYPASWAAADLAMSPGATALALPWRAYLQVPWIGNRVVANPASGYFARTVISGDDLEAGPIDTESSDPRSLFLEFCLSEGNRLTEFGRLLAPLGIRYVILTKVPGWQSFDWLNRQHDMTKVFDADTIEIYENQEAVPTAYDPLRHIVLQDWGQVLALAQRTPLIDYLIEVRHARPGPLNGPGIAAVQAVPAPRFITTTGDTPDSGTVDLQNGTRTVVLTDPAYAGWQLAGFKTTSQFGVTVAFTSPEGPVQRVRLAAIYGPWRLDEVCDIVGICIGLADITVLALALRRMPHVNSPAESPSEPD